MQYQPCSGVLKGTMKKLGLAMLATGLASIALAAAPAGAQPMLASAHNAGGPATPGTALSFRDNTTLIASYSLGEPTPYLVFRRVPNDRRKALWRPLDTAFELSHSDGRDYVRRRDGRPFQHVAFAVPVRYDNWPGEYSPFLPFRDGGVLIHSGRFQACAMSCDGLTTDSVFPMSLAPPDGHHVILQGERIDGRAVWNDRRDGAMVYAGEAVPVETDDVVGIIDPALPGDIRGELDRFFPRLMRFYTDRLGGLDEKPMLFASLDRDAEPDSDPESNSYSSQGGTLPGEVFLHMTGDGWFERQAVREQQLGAFLLAFYAHEASHLYQEYQGNRPEDYWIHEGGADAFAVLAVAALADEYPGYGEAKKRKSAAACAEGLQDGPLRTAIERDAFRLHYACGAVIQLAAEHAMRTAGSAHDLFDVWAVFKQRVSDGEPWAADPFLQVMEEMAGPAPAALGRRILSPDPQIGEAEMLAAMGLDPLQDAETASARSGAAAGP